MDKSKDDKHKRRKVQLACIYCRRSHMTCDEGRPCKRCIKRDIGHLCHDESPSKPNQGNDASRRSANPTNPSTNGKAKSPAVVPISSTINPAATTSSSIPSSSISKDRGVSATLAPGRKVSTSPILSLNFDAPSQNQLSNLSWGNSALGGAGFLGLGGAGFLGSNGDATASGDAAGGNEFNILSEFLESLDGNPLATPGAGSTFPNNGSTNYENDLVSSFAQTGEGVGTSNAGRDGRMLDTSALVSSASGNATTANWALPTLSTSAPLSTSTSARASRRPSFSELVLTAGSSSSSSGLGGVSAKTEKFLLTAADQKDGTRDERLGRVIQAKYDAGLLRPYNHVNGYARLNKWMEQNASQASRRRILKPLSIFRPAFRAVAQSLTNVDLVYIEEAFERLLLDYDRVFSTQGIPACLWRRTGEIYKGNKEFAELVGVGIEALREGRCTIYEFMQEESAVNYWEKYGAVSFDPGQKAVLTSCILKTKGTGINNKDVVNGDDRKPEGGLEKKENNFVPCCFSFTIRRDAWSIPCLIVGNFLPITPQ